MKSLFKNGQIFWFIGFFIGDGYTTYGRVGIDTTTPKFAEVIVDQLTQLTDKPVKFEIYGDHKKFRAILTRSFLHYPKKREDWSDYVKIRIDSENFRRKFSQFIQKTYEKIEELPKEYQLKFLQGFFDAEGTVSPDGTVQVDLAKDNFNLKLAKKISTLLSRFKIKNKLREKRRRISLIIEGRSAHITNLELFQELIGFSSPIKRRDLEIVIDVYSSSKDNRPHFWVEREILKVLQSRSSIELKELMWILRIKYDKLKVCLNRLMRKKLVRKVVLHKRVWLELTPSSVPIGKQD